MPLRLIEMICDDEARQEVEELVEEFKPLAVWHDRFMDEQVMVKILMAADRTEAVMDKLESKFTWDKGFRLLVTKVEATVPQAEEDAQEEKETPEEEEKKPILPTGLSRHEIAEDVQAACKLDRMFIALMVLSTIVAAVGLLRDNVAVIIGAMVIAPLIGPNVGVALGVTLGNVEMVRNGLRTAAVGAGVALLMAVAMGGILQVEVGRVVGAQPQDATVSMEDVVEGMEPPAPVADRPMLDELTSRAQVDLPDVILALAAGTVGALAFTTGIHTPLVGVMVAVALLPPLVASGLLGGTGEWAMSLRAMLLFLTNLICIMLSAVLTFMVQGLRPRTWWEADKAKRSSRKALAMLLVILLMLITIIVVARRTP